MSWSIPNRYRGFTLIEMTVASSILVLLCLIATLWLIGSVDLWWTSTAQGDAHARAQQVVNRLVEELRSCTRSALVSPPDILIPAAPNNTTVTFYMPEDLDVNDGNTTIVDANGNIEWDIAAPIQYLYVAAQRQLMRVENGQSTVLANNVQSVTFEDANITPSLKTNEVKVTVTLQEGTPQGRTLSSTSAAIVRLRN